MCGLKKTQSPDRFSGQGSCAKGLLVLRLAIPQPVDEWQEQRQHHHEKDQTPAALTKHKEEDGERDRQEKSLKSKRFDSGHRIDPSVQRINETNSTGSIAINGQLGDGPRMR
jgi:hypothetical protein